MKGWKIIVDYEIRYWQRQLLDDNVRMALIVRIAAGFLLMAFAALSGYLIPLLASECFPFRAVWMSFLICLGYDFFVRLFSFRTRIKVVPSMIRVLPVGKQTVAWYVLLSLWTDALNIFIPIWMSVTIGRADVPGYWVGLFIFTGCAINILCACYSRMGGNSVVWRAVIALLYIFPYVVSIAGWKIFAWPYWCPLLLLFVWLVTVFGFLSWFLLRYPYNDASLANEVSRIRVLKTGLYDIVIRPLWKGNALFIPLMTLLCMVFCPLMVRYDLLMGVPQTTLFFHLLIPMILLPLMMGNFAFSWQSIFWDGLVVNRRGLVEWLLFFKFKIVLVVDALFSIVALWVCGWSLTAKVLTAFIFATGFVSFISFSSHPFDNIRWEYLDRKPKRGMSFYLLFELLVYVGIGLFLKIIEIKLGLDACEQAMLLLGGLSLCLSPFWMKAIARCCRKRRYYLSDGFRESKCYL